MSQNPTELVLRVVAHLIERNAFDSATLRSLAECADGVDALIDSAECPNHSQLHAFSKGLRRIDTSTIDWKKVCTTLQEWSVDQGRSEQDRDAARAEAAPVWCFRFSGKKTLGGDGARACEAARGNGRAAKRPQGCTGASVDRAQHALVALRGRVARALDMV